MDGRLVAIVYGLQGLGGFANADAPIGAGKCRLLVARFLLDATALCEEEGVFRAGDAVIGFELAAERRDLLEPQRVSNLLDGVHDRRELAGPGHAQFAEPLLRRAVEVASDITFDLALANTEMPGEIGRAKLGDAGKLEPLRLIVENGPFD